MVIAIIQPNFLPWLGYFEQMARADLFVYLDDVQYTRKDWRNRNRLKSPTGVKVVTVPVKKHEAFRTLINEIRIADQPWRCKLLQQMESWYGDAKYWNKVFPLLQEVIEKDWEFMVDLNYALNKTIAGMLNITTPCRLSSDIPDKAADKNQKIIDICRHHGATILYDGQSAKNFLDIDLFNKHGVKVVLQDYFHTPYLQLWGDFVSHLSAVDLLMNCGDDSREILLSNPCPEGLR